MSGIPVLRGLRKNDGLHSLIFSRRRAERMLGEREEETVCGWHLGRLCKW